MRRESIAYGLFLLLISIGPLQAQTDSKKIKEFTTGQVNKISLDRLGDFYLVMAGGPVRKYDSLGNFMNEFSAPALSGLTVLEPWNPLRVFVYCQKTQEVLLLSHNLEQEQKIAVDPAWAIDPILASPAVLTSFWVLDKSDFSLKMIDSKSKSVVREVILGLPAGTDPEFVFLREYQSLIFLIDRKWGIYVLNTVGKVVHKIPVKGLDYLGFLGEEFYYLEAGKLRFYDLYTGERHDVPVDPAARFVMVTDERMIVVGQNTVEVIPFKQ